jgi:hypothetical protein
MIYKNIIDFIKGERLESLIYDLTGRKTIKDFEDYLDDYSDRDIVTLVLNDLKNIGKINGIIKIRKNKDWRNQTINLEK